MGPWSMPRMRPRYHSGSMLRLRHWIMLTPFSPTRRARASSSPSLSVTPGKKSRFSETQRPFFRATAMERRTSSKL